MLAKAIATALKQGKRTFITGMARGSDIYAAELVLEYRAQYPDIHLICALPHPDFEKYWSPEWQQRYRKILKAADYVKVIRPEFSMSSYQIRNEWMVQLLDFSLEGREVFLGEFDVQRPLLFCP